MSGFDALSTRDLLALTVIVSRSIGHDEGINAKELVAGAFEVADAFVEQSEGRWAIAARSEHTTRDKQQRNGKRQS